MSYPIYYRKDGRCLKRETDTTGREVIVPATPKSTLPLIISDVIFPDKDRFDKEILTLEEVSQDVYEQYILQFINRVERDVRDPMVQYRLHQHTQKLMKQ